MSQQLRIQKIGEIIERNKNKDSRVEKEIPLKGRLVRMRYTKYP